MVKIPTPRPRPRCLMADDHVIFSEALMLYLRAAVEIVGVAYDGRALVAEAARLRPEVVIVDVGMPLLNTLDAASRVKEFLPKVKFVFLTMHDDSNLAAAMLELGAVAFVLKHSAGSELLRSIDQVLRGQSYLTPRSKSGDWVEAKAGAEQFSTEMTPRRKDIVQLLADSKAMKETAGPSQIIQKLWSSKSTR